MQGLEDPEGVALGAAAAFELSELRKVLLAPGALATRREGNQGRNRALARDSAAEMVA